MFLRYSVGERNKVDPEIVVSTLNDYSEDMTETIFAHDGTIDDIVGDAVLSPMIRTQSTNIGQFIHA
jgi:class 3 adenylate cyclase